MQLTFTRHDERRYATVVVRDDGITLFVPSCDQPTWLPHDLAHYVVERALGLTHGFWGSIAAGAVFPGMKVLAGRQAPHAAARSREVLHEITNSQEGTESEVLVDFFVHLTQLGCPPGWEAQLRDMWHPSKLPPRSIAAQQVHQICTELHRAARHAAAMAGIACWSEHAAHLGYAVTASTSEEGAAVSFLCLLAVPATRLHELGRSLVMQRLQWIPAGRLTPGAHVRVAKPEPPAQQGL
jgi:hypothetical protein